MYESTNCLTKVKASTEYDVILNDMLQKTDILDGRKQVQIFILKMCSAKRTCFSGGSDRVSLFKN